MDYVLLTSFRDSVPLGVFIKSDEGTKGQKKKQRGYFPRKILSFAFCYCCCCVPNSKRYPVSVGIVSRGWKKERTGFIAGRRSPSYCG